MYTRYKSNFISISILSSLLLFLLFTPYTFALGKIGHQVICQLAFENLPTNTQSKVNILLNTLPKKHKELINKYNHRKTNTTVTFADSCTWADAIRRDKSFNKYRKWHYLNVTRDQTEVTAQTCDNNCITAAIKYHIKMLIAPYSKDHTSWEKLQALMFLGHWLGDIHQPMHVNFASDSGGNRTKVSMLNTANKGKKYVKCNNMHWLWDECLLYPSTQSIKGSQNKSSSFKYNVYQRNKDLYNRLYRTLSEQWEHAPVTLWQKDSIYTWATESLIIARKPSVLYCAINNKNSCDPIQKNTLKLPYLYQKEHQPILEKRMLQAAIRLTYTLEESL